MNDQSTLENEAHKQIWNLNDINNSAENEIINFYLLKQQFVQYLCTGEKSVAKSTYNNIKKELNKTEEKYNLKKSIFKAELYFYMGVLEMTQGNKIKSAGYIKDSYSKHKLILAQNKNPISMKTIGFIEVMAANIPEEYHGLVKMIGINPSIKLGLRKMKTACLSNKHFDKIWKKECVIYYAFALSKFNNKPKLAGKFLLNETHDFAISPLSAYFRSLAYSFMGLNDKAIKVLPNLLNNKVQKNNKIVAKFPFLAFVKGEYLIRSLNGKAYDYFTLYNNTSKSANYKATAQNYIGWTYLLKNEKELYLENLKKVNNYPAILSKDKQSHKEAMNPVTNTKLLSARLLYDGGYFARGISMLKTIQTKDISTKEKLEYHYRFARLYHGIKKYSKAKYHYGICVQIGAESIRYFGANAALKIADIYLKENKVDKAKYYFKLAAYGFNKNKEYKNSIKQAAKKQLKKL